MCSMLCFGVYSKYNMWWDSNWQRGKRLRHFFPSKLLFCLDAGWKRHIVHKFLFILGKWAHVAWFRTLFSQHFFPFYYFHLATNDVEYGKRIDWRWQKKDYFNINSKLEVNVTCDQHKNSLWMYACMFELVLKSLFMLANKRSCFRDRQKEKWSRKKL